MLTVNTCFKTGHVFRSSQSGLEETLGFRPACVSDAVDKEFSVLFVIDTNSEIRKVNNRFNKNQLVSLISKIYFCHKIIHVSDSSSVHNQERIHSTLNNGIQGVPGEMDKTSGECSLC